MLNKPTLLQRVKDQCGYLYDEVEEDAGHRRDKLWRELSHASLTVKKGLTKAGHTAKREVTHAGRSASRELVRTGHSVSREIAHKSHHVKKEVCKAGHAAHRQCHHARQDLKTNYRIAKDDVSDAIHRSRQYIRDSLVSSTSSGAEPAAAAAAAAATAAAAPAGSETQPTNTSEQDIVDQIRNYEAALRAPSFLHGINGLIQDRVTTAVDLIEYYQTRPELKTHTLEKELERIQYTVYTHNGHKLTTPSQIIQYEKETTQDDDCEILWRAANQSIFADLVTCVTSPQGLVRPQLAAATFVEDCTIEVDFGCSHPYLQAECFMNVSIPSEEGEVLHLAGVVVAIYFCPMSHVLTTKVSHVCPGPQLSEAQALGAARGLLS